MDLFGCEGLWQVQVGEHTLTLTHPQGGQVDVIQTPRRCVF